MNIVLVGCGKTGLAIMEGLIAEDHDITVIDFSAEIIEGIKNNHDILCICGNCTDVNVLKEAGVDKCNLFISVTSSDETNILSCYFAKKLGAPYTMARIRDAINYDSQNFITENMQIDYVINPERTVAKVIDYTISLPNAARAQFFSSKKLEMIELHLKQDSMFDGISVIEARSRTKAQFLICGVLRNGDFYIPNGSFTLCAGDRIGITATPENFELLLSDMGYSVKGKKGTTLIAGGSRVAYYLAKQLSKNKRGCIIFEKDSAVCCQLENELGSIAQIINADGSDRDTLNEYGLEEANAFVSLTGFDEENILMSYYAHSVGVPNVIAKVNRYEMMSTAEKIGVDNVVNPRIIVSDMVKRYARGLENTIDSGVETLYSLFDFQAEALEFIVGSAFTQTGVKISKLKLKKDIIIAGIVRNNRTIIPGGDDTIEPEDRVAIVTKLKHLDNLNSILR